MRETAGARDWSRTSDRPASGFPLLLFQSKKKGGRKTALLVTWCLLCPGRRCSAALEGLRRNAEELQVRSAGGLVAADGLGSAVGSAGQGEELEDVHISIPSRQNFVERYIGYIGFY